MTEDKPSFVFGLRDLTIAVVLSRRLPAVLANLCQMAQWNLRNYRALSYQEPPKIIAVSAHKNRCRVSDESTAIVEVDLEQAQAVLFIRSTIPGLVVAAVEEYYLARIKAPAPVNELTAINPDGTVRLTSCFAPEQSFLHCARVDGRTSDGCGGGFGKAVSVEEHSSDTV